MGWWRPREVSGCLLYTSVLQYDSTGTPYDLRAVAAALMYDDMINGWIENAEIDEIYAQLQGLSLLVGGEDEEDVYKRQAQRLRAALPPAKGGPPPALH